MYESETMIKHVLFYLFVYLFIYGCFFLRLNVFCMLNVASLTVCSYIMHNKE